MPMPAPEVSSPNSDRPGPSPLISVLMPVFNGADYIGEALDSALNQEFSDFEIIIVDDGSTDTSAAIAREWATSARVPVRLIQQSNQGLPTARNTAIAAARGRLLALLDADDIWLPGHLRLAAAAFARQPELGLAHANIERIDAAGNALSVPRRHWARQRDAFRALALRLEHVSCPTAVFARQTLERVGGFDPAFTGLGCEDRDLWLRIVQVAPAHYIDRVTARYRVHPGSMSNRRGRMHQARLLLADKVAATDAGRPLKRSMRAMIESDLGLEYAQATSRRWRAVAAQIKACGRQPALAVIWRRLFGALRAALRPRLAADSDLLRARTQEQRT